MRTSFCLVLILLSIMPLPAAYYRTNSIGQLMEEIPELTLSGYEAESDEFSAVYYLDGEVIRRMSGEGNSRIVEEGGSVTTTLYDESGNVISETTINDGSEVVNNFEYSDNGILYRVIESRDGEIERITTYLYSPLSQLAAIYYDSPEGSVSYVSDTSFSYTAEGVPVRVREFPGLLVRDEYGKDGDGRSVTVSDDGFVTIREDVDGVVRESIYTPDGLLSSRYTYDGDGVASYIEEYSYEDGLLVSSSVIDGSSRIDSIYSNGSIVFEMRYSSSILASSREYNADRSFTETVYRNGSPYARVGYDADGIRVLSLEVL